MTLSREELLAQAKQHINLGHEKRNQCFLRQLELSMDSPGTSLPQAAGHKDHPWSDLVSLYRFAENVQIPIEALRQARAQIVLNSIPENSPVLIVHDVSLLDFSRQNAKTDRRPIGDHQGKGYEYICCAAVNPASGQLLGVLHDTVVNAEGPDDRTTMNYEFDPLFADFSPEEKKRIRENHRHQTAVHINGLAALAGNRHFIHVADREFDDIFVLAQCQKENADFVIRSMGNRNVQIQEAGWIPPEALTQKQAGHPLEPGWVYAHLSRVITALPLQPYKVLPLDSRGRVTTPERAVRTAHLSIGTCRVRLYRRAIRNRQYFSTPRPVEVNMVVIRETDIPPGEQGLLWVLFTSLPVETLEQLFYVGYLYELRWKIEEFFRLLKSGYQIEKHRFFDALKTAKVLVVLTMAAMTLCHLKDDLNLPAGGYLDDTSYQNIKAAYKDLENPDLDIHWRLLAFIAKSGGWLGRRNDPLGPTILMRGLLQVLAIFNAVQHYEGLIQEILDKPDILQKFICV